MTTVLIVIFSVVVAVILAIIYGSGRAKNEAQDKIIGRILAANKVNNIKAPMPGLVLRTSVAIGDVIKKGDPLLVLEAMKMENVIKAAGDGVVKKINAIERTAVEKGSILIEFE